MFVGFVEELEWKETQRDLLRQAGGRYPNPAPTLWHCGGSKVNCPSPSPRLPLPRAPTSPHPQPYSETCTFHAAARPPTSHGNPRLYASVGEPRAATSPLCRRHLGTGRLWREVKVTSPSACPDRPSSLPAGDPGGHEDCPQPRRPQSPACRARLRGVLVTDWGHPPPDLHTLPSPPDRAPRRWPSPRPRLRTGRPGGGKQRPARPWLRVVTRATRPARTAHEASLSRSPMQIESTACPIQTVFVSASGSLTRVLEPL